MSKLPAPRLQLRWEKSTLKREYQWECHYELVIPLQEHDIRRESYDSKGNTKIGPRELVVKMKEPCLRDGNNVPCTSDEGGYADTPFRDGAHAQWDSEVLGGLPIFVIAPSGKSYLVEKTVDTKK